MNSPTPTMTATKVGCRSTGIEATAGTVTSIFGGSTTADLTVYIGGQP